MQVLLLKISGKFNISKEITDSLNTSRFYLLKVSCWNNANEFHVYFRC